MGLSLEAAAQAAGLRLVSGIRAVKQGRGPNARHDKQPFWFVHEPGEVTGIFARLRDKEELAQLLIAYASSAGKLSFLQFGGARGFQIKTAHPQPPRRKD